MLGLNQKTCHPGLLDYSSFSPLRHFGSAPLLPVGGVLFMYPASKQACKIFLSIGMWLSIHSWLILSKQAWISASRIHRGELRLERQKNTVQSHLHRSGIVKYCSPWTFSDIWFYYGFGLRTLLYEQVFEWIDFAFRVVLKLTIVVYRIRRRRCPVSHTRFIT